MNDNKITGHSQRKKPNKKRNLLIAILGIILVVCIGMIASYYYKQYKGKQEYAKLKKQAAVETEEKNDIDMQLPKENQEKELVIPIDFEALWKTNPDVYAWIEIPDTQVAYPILQSTKDVEDYYLDHTVERVAGLPGSIYTRRDTPKDFTHTNAVIYGHNMKNGSMFAGLHKYETENYMKEHPYIYIYTPEHIYKYEIFAAVTYSDILISSSFDFTTDAGLQQYVASLQDTKGMGDQYNEEVKIVPGDKLITLSTCIANRPTNRFIVVAVQRSEE
ncbi:MAG: class B sortase [Lachnospiraceae bacterium]